MPGLVPGRWVCREAWSAIDQAFFIGGRVGADVIGLVVSLVVLTVAGDQFVVGLARIAGGLHVRPTVIGALVGGLGTSIPELIVAGIAAARGHPQIATGSLIGSIIANVSLALAIAAMVAPLRVDSRTVRREAPLSVGAVILFASVSHGGTSRTGGAVLAAALVVALAGLLLNARGGRAEDVLGPEVGDFFDRPARHGLGPEIARSVLTIAAMVVGADLLVGSGAGLVERLGVGQGLIGLTVVAVGTSAPLIASSIQASRRRDHDLVVGNVLGGNLFIALAGGAIVAFVGIGGRSAPGDATLWLMVVVVSAAWAFMGRGSSINRWEAMLLLLAYAVTLPLVAT